MSKFEPRQGDYFEVSKLTEEKYKDICKAYNVEYEYRAIRPSCWKYTVFEGAYFSYSNKEFHNRLLTYEDVFPIGDPVNHPSHYTDHPSGVECIQITEHMDFCSGNAMKYLWRCDKKNETPLEDLKKARWYIDRKIKMLEQSE